MSVISSATLSSLTAQSVTLSVSAANVANLYSRGVDPSSRGLDTEPDAGPDLGAFVPRRVVHESMPGGEVRTEVVAVSPPSTLTYRPGSPDADANGLVARPNVALEEEMVIQLQARRAYEANLATLKVGDRMLGELLDLVS